jgi:hypothetical protein
VKIVGLDATAVEMVLELESSSLGLKERLFFEMFMLKLIGHLSGDNPRYAEIR